MLPEQRGICYGELLRYRFDASVADCVGFLYSGCASNANHFASYEACARACGPWRADAVCERPPDIGHGQCGAKDAGGERKKFGGKSSGLSEG